MCISVAGATASVHHHRYTSIRLSEAPAPDSHNCEWINRLKHLQYRVMNRANCDTRTNGNDTHECRDATKREIIQHTIVSLVSPLMESAHSALTLHYTFQGLDFTTVHDAVRRDARFRCEEVSDTQRWGLKSVRVFCSSHTSHASPLRDGLTISQKSR